MDDLAKSTEERMRENKSNTIIETGFHCSGPMLKKNFKVFFHDRSMWLNSGEHVRSDQVELKRQGNQMYSEIWLSGISEITENTFRLTHSHAHSVWSW